MYNEIKKVITLADGREIEISTGKLAKQATGSVVVKMGKTMLLATVVAADDAKEDVDDSMVIERMPSDWEPQAGSSIVTADGDVAFLKSDGTWNWVE